MTYQKQDTVLEAIKQNVVNCYPRFLTGQSDIVIIGKINELTKKPLIHFMLVSKTYPLLFKSDRFNIIKTIDKKKQGEEIALEIQYAMIADQIDYIEFALELRDTKLELKQPKLWQCQLCKCRRSDTHMPVASASSEAFCSFECESYFKMINQRRIW